MIAWKGLLKKEYRLGRDHLIGTLIVQGFLIAAYIYLFLRYGDQNVNNAPLGLMITISMIYIPSYVLLSLKKEQLHLWLHNPNPAWKLVFAKLLNAFFAFFITMVVSLIFGSYFFWNILSQHIEVINWPVLIKLASIGFLYFSAITIHVSIWILFFWVVYQWIKTFLGKWSNMVIVGALFLFFWGIGKFTMSNMYETLTHWGRVNVKVGSVLMIDHGLITFNSIPLFVGTFVFYLVISIGLFTLSTWLIDRKVEV